MNSNNFSNDTILPRSAQVGPQTFIFLSGLLFTLLLLCWLYCITKRVRGTFKELKSLGRNQSNESTLKKIRKIKSKQNKHIYFVCCILLFIAHTCGRSLIYLAFVLVEYFVVKSECGQYETTKELQFVYSLLRVIFPALSITGVLFLGSLISLGTFLLYVKESYSYFGKNLKAIRIWFFIGALQIISVLVLMIVPYVAVLGSVALSLYLIIDYIFLIIALKKLVRILVMKKMDATYQSELKFRYKQCIKGIRALSRPMFATLFFYIFGLIMEQVSAWVTIGDCFTRIIYGSDIQLETATLLLLENIASFLWIITYIAALQFYISSLLVVVAYFCHSYSNRRESKNERKRLITGVRTSRYDNTGNESEA